MLFKTVLLYLGVTAGSLVSAYLVHGESSLSCDVHMLTDAGWVQGCLREAEEDVVYASFRGVPYAEQPLQDQRFAELQPVNPWTGIYEAINEGPICPQHDLIFFEMMQPQGVSEACIHANVHVPIDSSTNSSYLLDLVGNSDRTDGGLPIIVYIHAGAFGFASGDADVNGPEYLVTKGVIVITFNYRIGPFGYLSLNSPSIPGNNGLRDQITLLRWVKRNAQNFGGNPNDVTLAGQSAGGASVHLLSLSNAAKGLFNRAILMSGVASRSFYSPEPKYSQDVAEQYLELLGINSTDAVTIHKELVEMPLSLLLSTWRTILDQQGLIVFAPVIESPHEGVTMVLDDDPETLIAKGRGNDVPFIIGFTDVEAELVRSRLEELNMAQVIKENPSAALVSSLLYTISPEKAVEYGNLVLQRYFNGSEPTIDGYLKIVTDSMFIYPVIHLAKLRAVQKGVRTYLYQFAYNADNSTLKVALNQNYTGAAHQEDTTYIFRLNSILGAHSSFPPTNNDDLMKDWMTDIVINFIKCSDPTCSEGYESEWPEVDRSELKYQDFRAPLQYRHIPLTPAQKDMVQFYDNLFAQTY